MNAYLKNGLQMCWFIGSVSVLYYVITSDTQRMQEPEVVTGVPQGMAYNDSRLSVIIDGDMHIYHGRNSASIVDAAAWIDTEMRDGDSESIEIGHVNNRVQYITVEDYTVKF